MILVFIILLILFYCFKGPGVLFKGTQENYSVYEDPSNRWVDVLKSPYEGRHKYVNQIDYWRDAPNIDLEGTFQDKKGILLKDVDWSRIDPYTYSKLVTYIQGKDQSSMIKSINAI